MASELARKPCMLLTDPQPLTCQLRRMDENSRCSSVSLMAEIELKNTSTSPIEIEYWLTALQGLNLIVNDGNGKVVSEGHFADRFSPTLDPRILRLEPGESFRASVHLFATVPHALQVPGNYSIKAIYEYNGFQAESGFVSVST